MRIWITILLNVVMMYDALVMTHTMQRNLLNVGQVKNGPFGIEKVIQGAKTESVPLGELKKLSEERMLLFDEDLMTFAMGNCITLEDTNGNRKLLKKRYEQKIDAVAAMMDAYIAFKANREAFE